MFITNQLALVLSPGILWDLFKWIFVVLRKIWGRHFIECSVEQMGCVQHMFETKLIKIADEEKNLEFFTQLARYVSLFLLWWETIVGRQISYLRQQKQNVYIPASVYTSSDEACKKSVGFFKMHTEVTQRILWKCVIRCQNFITCVESCRNLKTLYLKVYCPLL